MGVDVQHRETEQPGSGVPPAAERPPTSEGIGFGKPPAQTLARPTELIVVLALLIVVLILGSSSGTAQAVAVNMVVWALLAYSFNIIYGLVGGFALGQGLFFGIAGFTTVYAYSEYHASQYVGIGVGVLASVLIAAGVGLPTLRLKGFYFALVSLTLPLIADNIFNGLKLYAVAKPILSYNSVGNFFFLEQGPYIFIGCGCIAVIALVTYVWLRSRTGYYWVSIRENPGSASASGVPVLRYRVYGFIAASIVASVAGVIYTELVGVFSPDDVFGLAGGAFSPSVIALLVALVGGVGTISGPLVGAVVLAPLYTILTQRLGNDAGVSTLAFALALIAVGLWLPGGIWPKLNRLLSHGPSFLHMRKLVLRGGK